MMNYAELRRLRGEHLRRMAEPDDLCALRQQAERIRADRALAARGIIADAERDRLRREIQSAGEVPCR